MADLYADGSRGIYIPQHFAQSVKREFVQNVSDEDWQVLEAGPNANGRELYWEVWDTVLNDARITAPDGREGFLLQNGDLWVVWGDEDPDYANLLEV